MFSRTSSVRTSTLIGSGVRLEAAKLTGQGSVRIDGDYVGDIEINALVIGETGRVTGDIWAETVKVAGRVTGNIHSGETVYITATAYVEGCIETRSLITDDGCWFNGKCQMINAKTEEIPLLEADATENFDHKVERFISVLQSQQPIEHIPK